jgi:hypothetical protein
MKKHARTQNEYHNPLAVEPESAKDAAANYAYGFSRRSKVPPNKQKDFFKCSRC